MPALSIEQLKREAMDGIVRLDASLAECARPLPGLTATEVAGSVNLLDAVRAEGRSRRLVTALMVLCWLETETPELEYAE